MLSFRRMAVLVVFAVGFISSCNIDQTQGDLDPRYSVVITSFDPDWKIRAIKAIRADTGLGLADAKHLIEETPSVIQAGLSRSEADALAERLRSHHLSVELRAD